MQFAPLNLEVSTLKFVQKILTKVGTFSQSIAVHASLVKLFS
jgi:hypothetical protein